MTSALQILYIWRSPARRRQDLGGAGKNDQSDPEPDFCHRHRDNHHGHRRGDFDPSRRSYAGASKGQHPESCSSRKLLICYQCESLLLLLGECEPPSSRTFSNGIIILGRVPVLLYCGDTNSIFVQSEELAGATKSVKLEIWNFSMDLYNPTRLLLSQERELGRSVSNRSDYLGPGNNSNGGVSSSGLSRLGLIKNDQLPGAVLEARKRLIERLGGVSLTEIRQADVLGVNHSSLDQKIPMRRTNTKTPYCDSASIQTEQDLPFHISNRKKPPTEIRGAFFSLQSEILKTSKGEDGGEFMEELPDCCICLEKFEDGDKLIRLRCNHKFHPYCLEPWLRSNGDCPYCRRNI